MNHDELIEFLEENKDFQEYVEKFCRAKKITVEQALTLKIVENVARHYMREEWK